MTGTTPTPHTTLLIATHNPGKVAEIAAMLASAGIDCMSLREAGVTLEVEEIGATFLANATLKAVQYARAAGLPTLADDSGLEVDALGGLPGVQTARYGGEGLAQVERNQLVLNRLAWTPPAERTARFRCVMVLAAADGQVLGGAEGVCPGLIADAPRGSGGFGYDPIFYLPELGCTMAELTPEEKHAVSHRGRALAAMLPIIRRELGHVESVT